MDPALVLMNSGTGGRFSLSFFFFTTHDWRVNAGGPDGPVPDSVIVCVILLCYICVRETLCALASGAK